MCGGYEHVQCISAWICICAYTCVLCVHVIMCAHSIASTYVLLHMCVLGAGEYVKVGALEVKDEEQSLPL